MISEQECEQALKLFNSGHWLQLEGSVGRWVNSFLEADIIIQDKNNKNILHYEPSLVTYLMDRIEDMINEFNLTNELSISKDRKALENKALQDKL